MRAVLPTSPLNAEAGGSRLQAPQSRAQLSKVLWASWGGAENVEFEVPWRRELHRLCCFAHHLNATW